MFEKKLNVYITTYNRSKYLKLSIDSVLKQTYKDFDLYILDNCSDDDTAELIGSYNDSRIHYIRHESNIGGISNIKYAFAHNEAEYFIIFHDDDTMNSDMLYTEVDYLDSHPEVSIVSSISDHIDENGEHYEAAKSAMEIKMAQQNIEEFVYSGEEFLNSYLNEGANVVFPSVMYRNEFMRSKGLTLIEEAGPSCDTELMFEIGRNGGRIAILNKLLMNTRVHNQDSFQHFGIMYEKLFSYLKCDSYFANLLKKYQNGCERLYKRLSRIIAVYLMQGKYDLIQATENEKMVWKALGGKKIDRIKYKTIELAYKCMPVIVSNVADDYLSGAKRK